MSAQTLWSLELFRDSRLKSHIFFYCLKICPLKCFSTLASLEKSFKLLALYKHYSSLEILIQDQKLLGSKYITLILALSQQREGIVLILTTV
jgi:hypothetical protein